MYKYLILGLVQGLTEFLPVSSSGHLVILQNIMGINKDVIAVTVVLHLATAFSVVVFFFRDIFEALHDLRLFMNVLIVTVITGIIAIAGKDFFESLFSSPRAVSLSLLITGIVLISTLKITYPRKNINQIRLKDAVILGITQAIAIIPGISRSGITISTLLFRHFNAETAFKFSFLAAIPAIFGASLLELKDISELTINKMYLTVGFVVSFIAGIIALWGLRKVVTSGKLHYFGFYCIAAGILALIFLR